MVQEPENLFGERQSAVNVLSLGNVEADKPVTTTMPEVDFSIQSKHLLPSAQHRLMVPLVRVQTDGIGITPDSKSVPSSRNGALRRVNRKAQMSPELSMDATGFNFNNYQDLDVSTNNNDNDSPNLNNMSLNEFPNFTQTQKIGSMAIYANARQVAQEALLIQTANNQIDKAKQSERHLSD